MPRFIAALILLSSIAASAADTVGEKSTRSDVVIRRLTVSETSIRAYSVATPSKERVLIMIHPPVRPAITVPPNFPYSVTIDESAAESDDMHIVFSVYDRERGSSRIIESVAVRKTGEVEFTSPDVHAKYIQSARNTDEAIAELNKQLNELSE